MRTNRRSLRRLLHTAIAGVVAVFFGLAIVDAWRRTDGTLPPWPRAIGAGALWWLGLAAAGLGWAALLDGPRRRHIAALVVTQPAKYVPGGVWQAAGQVGIARGSGIKPRNAAVAFSVFAVSQVCAGAVFALTLGLTGGWGGPAARIALVVASLATLLLLDRRWMAAAINRLPQLRGEPVRLPAQSSILIAWAGNTVALAASSVGYLLLLDGTTGNSQVLLTILAFATAWAIGFLAIPFPSGLGIREAALVGILGAATPASLIVVASIYHRLVTIAAEGLAAIPAAIALRRRTIFETDLSRSARRRRDR